MPKLPLVVALLATLASAASAYGSPTTTVMHLELPATTSHYVDLGAKGYSSGDYFLATGRIREAPSGKLAGRLGGVWTILSQAADFADFDLGLAHGTLVVSGRIVHGAKPSILAITGGTGAYAGAGGSVTFRELKSSATLIVHVR